MGAAHRADQAALPQDQQEGWASSVPAGPRDTLCDIVTSTAISGQYDSFRFEESDAGNIKMRSMIGLIEEFSFEHRRIILKIDIEGGEYDLLLNAEEKDLKKFKQLTIEFHDFVNPNLRIINSIIINKLTSMGFSLISSKPAHFRYGSDHYDVLLINDQK